MGRLIVIEGTDSSGKETQTKKLFERFEREGKKVRKISFPNYESPACAPVKMYLAGEFGDNANKVNPYPVSAMYAIDRYASYKKDWGEFYENDGILITDRYTTSNMVHQASKIADENEKKKYLDWLEDLEYEKMELPRPDMVIFLNMPTEMAVKLMAERKNKITGEDKKDIHEKNVDYLKKSYTNACEIADKYSWKEIKCVENGRLKSIDEIGDEIYSQVLSILG
ncbi:Thymidylate kinase [Fusobacterium sp. DD29]|uniref:dTMP kinase n=1 Tax=unclassified Fusobacterium TaxID=2648384 RepID=UPI001B8D4631|nr:MULTISPECIES: thymidylate kinase [unclassified Fusobacterium]MBR8701952.1 Thymidylate kinase [Fusobacterium sp. DD45]MBR8711753.1 Thymidylate kinase [Fusobacterium sp. DD28]MBR8750148.1 Thymidylate kinase [Fusobacterium sp. DD29]MBR8752320.1 Thymidylate kinase [Fusobacterium sp. DD26]MBR8762395.1 Thymidylate kinase [Fusobacterium sp. DD25]